MLHARCRPKEGYDKCCVGIQNDEAAVDHAIEHDKSEHAEGPFVGPNG